MQSIIKLKELHSFSHDIYQVVVSLQELSVLEMQRIRKQVIDTRSSMEKILDIFLDVRFSQNRQVEKALKKQHSFPKSTRVFVFLSQNQRFSDTNIGSVWTTFRDAVLHEKPDGLVIVGETGKEFAQRENSEAFSRAEFLNLPQKLPTIHDLHELFKKISSYDLIVVHHGQFQNLLIQQAATKDISARGELLTAEEQAERQIRHFFFEPSLEILVTYFEQEIERGLLQQSIHESRLAHVGSRVQTLESSRNSIEEKISRMHLQLNRSKRRLATKKQQQRLAGMTLWQ